jgi:uncharacterized delta-60 repeat protein
VFVIVATLAGYTLAAARDSPTIRATTDFDGRIDMAQAVALTDDGRVLAAGSSALGRESRFAIARYLPDGSPDPTFGDRGRVLTPFADEADAGASDVLATPDARVLVIGSGVSDAVADAIEVLRYLPDGSLDSTFGGDGRVRISERRFEEPCALYSSAAVLQPNGRLIVVGTGGCGGEGDGTYTVVIRLLSNGKLDGSFGSRGTQTLSFSDNCSFATSVALQDDGRILIAGGDDPECGYPGYGRFGVVRLTRGGRYDRSFSGDGRQRVLFRGSKSWAASVLATGNGQITLLGTADPFGRRGGEAVAIARLREDGRLDSRFARNGRTTHDIPGSQSFVVAGATMSSGGFAVTATTRPPGGRYLRAVVGVVRRSGRVATAFGTRGFRVLSFDGARELAGDIAAGESGLVAVGSSTQPATRSDFSLARIRQR